MNRPDQVVSRGEECFRAGNLDEARTLFERVLHENPLHYEAMNNMGTILYTQGDVPAAEQCYQKAFALKQDHTDTLLNLADLYFHLKRWNEAAIFLERYLRIVPLDCGRFNQLALAYMESGDRRQAIQVLESSLDIQPDQQEIQKVLNALKPVPSVKSARNQRRVPMVSVGLPVYNGGRLLPHAIESILAQDFDDFELLISDNCSTDETAEVCLDYQRRDERVRYYRFDENRGGLCNFLNVLGLAQAPFFMWASHDDLRRETFIRACLASFHQDQSVVLVYPFTTILDSDSRFRGIARDTYSVNQESPAERFKNLIWGIGMCNAFYGIFRSSALKKVKSWWTSLYFDNLALAEIALLGKIVQLEEPLFVRRLTGRYTAASYEERIANVISAISLNWFDEGISFPHIRLAYAHLELVNESTIDAAGKDASMKEVLNCFRTRFGSEMKYEIDRAIALINRGHFYHQWNQRSPVLESLSRTEALLPFHVSGLLQRLQEAMFFFPEREDLVKTYRTCADRLLNRFQG